LLLKVFLVSFHYLLRNANWVGS